jgi:hypothetical protein
VLLTAYCQQELASLARPMPWLRLAITLRHVFWEVRSWPFASFSCATEFGRYRCKADSGNLFRSADLWDHGLAPKRYRLRNEAGPTGKSVRFIRSVFVLSQAIRAKIFFFRFSELYDLLCAIPARPRGADASSRTLRREAMDAEAVTDEHGRSGRQNRVVPIPRRWDQACMSLAGQATVARKPGTPRRARIRRKPIAQGRLGRSG